MEESMGASGRGPGLYEFLIEAELQHYYSGLKNDLKVNTVAQIKYVEDDDLMQIGMTKPESRRLKKFFHRYYPQTYLRRIKQMILPRKDDSMRSFAIPDSFPEKPSVKVPSKHIIPTDNIFVNKELGIGEFGVVQQGVWTNEDGERIQVAIKKLSKERMQNNPMEFLKEAAIMHTIDHEHIVRLYGVVLETNALMLVTELAPLRSLLECLKEPALRPSFPILSLCDFAFQACDGMQYLESKRLIHRDLAARNILVFSKNKIKISDFGLSRALGVGKDYYQTNFNVNLKLPIAWCAPECINYLRFTSASDVWAYGVTLWEMFSYGFQPWAALTGQQILEAIDEPHFQRLEQPEACPKEYFLLMTKCWQHDPNKRPKFSEIVTTLPECKPEQVQTIQDYPDANGSPKPKHDQLQYKVGDVITVLDKKPLSECGYLWKGALNNGKTGLFNPAHTVAYLGTNIPSMKSSFSRADSKSGVYSSKRRLRPEMISCPQGDFRHTGHVGLDGAFFGDISCLGEKYHLLPKQIVTPYKPHEDGEGSSSSLIRAASDVSDKAPLLKKAGEVMKNGLHEENWSNINNDKGNDKSWAKNNQDHEYHEISDDEDLQIESPRFERCLDFGPSLMDEVFKALGTKTEECDEAKDEANNVKNEIKEINSKTKEKKKQSMVKPISAMDQKTLDSAIAMANEMASRSMLELDHRSESDVALDSPNTPSSPTKHKFSFRLPTTRSSPKSERRNFAEEAACIPDIQETLTDEAKEAYTSLVEKNAVPQVEEETNPLRMLRSGVPVRPKVRGNKHVSNRGLVNDNAGHTSLRLSDHRLSDSRSSTYSTQNTDSNRGPPPVSPKPNVQQLPSPPFTKTTPDSETASTISPTDDNIRQSLSNNGHTQYRSTENAPSRGEQITVDVHGNMIPLPPRDRTKPMQQHKPRQRKHPLLIPGATSKSLAKSSGSLPDVSPEQTNGKHDLSETTSVSSEILSPLSSPVSLATSSTPTSEMTFEEDGENTKPQSHSLNPPAKPPRSQIVDDSFDNQIQADMDSLDDIPEEDAPIPPNNHHVSCEDLLDFACDRPNTKRTQGRARGTDSDEVRIMQKVLACEVPVRRKLEVSPEECVDVLNETDWDVHKAIKYVKLQTLLRTQMVSISNCKQTLINCNWDVQKAYSYLLATYGVTEDSTEV